MGPEWVICKMVNTQAGAWCDVDGPTGMFGASSNQGFHLSRTQASAPVIVSRYQSVSEVQYRLEQDFSCTRACQRYVGETPLWRLVQLCDLGPKVMVTPKFNIYLRKRRAKIT